MSDFVTVVSGVPRSGTSLMMQMLQAGGMPVLSDGLRGPDEDNPRGYLELEAVKRTRKDAGWVADAVGKTVKVVYPLLRDLARNYSYRVILMRRDLRDAIASQRAMLARLGRSGSELSDERLAAVYETQLSETVAWVEQQPNFSLLEVGYSDCVHSPAIAAARVNAFVGGKLDEQRMVAAVDPVLYRRSSSKAVLS